MALFLGFKGDLVLAKWIGVTEMRSLSLSVIIFLALSTIGNACQGNACGAINVFFQNGCYYATNNGSQSVNVSFGQGAGSISTTISPGQTHKFTFFGQCFNSFVGDTYASY